MLSGGRVWYNKASSLCLNTLSCGQESPLKPLRIAIECDIRTSWKKKELRNKNGCIYCVGEYILYCK